MALRRNFSGPESATDMIKSSEDSASLVVCTQKNFFGWGDSGLFVSFKVLSMNMPKLASALVMHVSAYPYQ